MNVAFGHAESEVSCEMCRVYQITDWIYRSGAQRRFTSKIYICGSSTCKWLLKSLGVHEIVKRESKQ